MSQQTPRDSDPDGRARSRARGDEEPGAHSGRESRPRDRVIPGTASAAEGYSEKGGTAHGETLEGVEVPRPGDDEKKQDE